MTMPGARRITVEGTTYDYLIKGEKKECVGTVVRLTLQAPGGKCTTHVFRARSEGAAFTPKDVSHVIKVLTFNQGRSPGPLELPNWRSS